LHVSQLSKPELVAAMKVFYAYHVIKPGKKCLVIPRAKCPILPEIRLEILFWNGQSGFAFLAPRHIDAALRCFLQDICGIHCGRSSATTFVALLQCRIHFERKSNKAADQSYCLPSRPFGIPTASASPRHLSWLFSFGGSLLCTL
jgi:hypothetical protein